MKIIMNQETQKIELHFTKSEYIAMSEAWKCELKSAYQWSRYAGAWVSRSTQNHYWALQTAKKLGFDTDSIEKTGARLSYAEQLEVKAEKAEARAERMEEHAANAEKRAENLQSELNSHHGDIAFFTQPIIAGHSGSQRFGRQREKIFNRCQKGFEEYRKSEYFQDRAETARQTADMAQLKNPIYLHNRIKECKATISKLEKNVIHYEEQLYKIENGEIIKRYNGEILTAEKYENWITETLEKMEYEIDKLAFMENHLDEIGGNRFSKDNIKPGYIVNMKRWGKCEILSVGPQNVQYKILTGGAAGLGGVEPYAAIVEIIEAKETKQGIKNPFKTGDILCKYYGMESRNGVYKAYQVIKTTGTGVKIREIAIENKLPVPNKFTGEPMQKKVTKSNYSEWVGVCVDDWRLDKYNLEGVMAHA